MKNFAIQLAKKAGTEVNRQFNQDKVFKVKKKTQIITPADLIADKIIIAGLRKRFPAYGIISEESGKYKPTANYVWVVDPLDGTTNFSIGSPLFAVSIGLFLKNNPILAIVYAPAMNELYVAEFKKGAYLNNKKIKVSKTNHLSQSFFTYCHGSEIKDIKRAMKIYNNIKLKVLDSRQLGAASIELGFVASGRTDCIAIPGAHVWDVGPGALIVREAGGKVTNFKGIDWNLKSKDMVASNGKIHGQLIKFLKKI